MADGAELGLRIRGGIEFGIGIFIASVDEDSGADRAGFQVRVFFQGLFFLFFSWVFQVYSRACRQKNTFCEELKLLNYSVTTYNQHIFGLKVFSRNI